MWPRASSIVTAAILPRRRPALQFLRCFRGHLGQLAHRRSLVSRLGRDMAGRDDYVAPELQADARLVRPQPDIVRAQVPDGDDGHEASHPCPPPAPPPPPPPPPPATSPAPRPPSHRTARWS